MATLTTDLRADIRKANDNFESTFNRGDAVGMAELCTENGMLRLTPRGLVLLGALVLAVSCVGIPVRVLAQEPGDRVRVTAPDVNIRRYTGTLVALPIDTLVVDTLRVAVASVTQLELYRGRKSQAGKGALIGTLVGGGIGLGLSIAWIANDCDFITSSGCDDHEAAIIAGGMLFFGAAGALIGVGIGALSRTDRWEVVPLGRLRASIVPLRAGRFGVGLSIRF